MFQSEAYSELEDIHPPPPPQQFGNVEPACVLGDRESQYLVSPKQHFRICEFIAKNDNIDICKMTKEPIQKHLGTLEKTYLHKLCPSPTENFAIVTPLPPSPPSFSPIIPNLQSLPAPPPLGDRDQDTGEHVEENILITSEPSSPIMNTSPKKKQGKLRVSFSDDIKRNIIEDLNTDIETFDAGELLQELENIAGNIFNQE